MGTTKRKIIDCRDFPNEIGCTLLISGSEKEVLKAAIRHAVDEHGHQDTPELHRQIKAMLRNEPKQFPNKNSNNKLNKKKGNTK
jgi:predicted small metal-binding protein